MRVDLPDPFWPTSACTSPTRTCRPTSSRALVPGKVLLTLYRLRTISPWSRPGCSGCVMSRLPRSRRAWPGGRHSQLEHDRQVVPAVLQRRVNALRLAGEGHAGETAEHL